MTAGLRPYPAMKNSGVQWLGNVPAHWEVFRAGHLLREVDVRSKTGTETHLSMSQRLGLVPSSEMEERRLVSESYVGAKLCEIDDLVLNRLKAHLGVFARASQPGLVSPDYTVLRAVSRDGTIAFLEYILRSLPCRTELRTRAKGLVEGFWRLYTDDFYQIKLSLPPISEQSAIVRFLDQADRRIRRYIRAKQKLIKLLEEQKQGILLRAVTRGLDPSVRLKPSGVEWLGDVPEHWAVKRLKWVTRLQRGYDLPADKRTRGSVPVVSSGGVIDTHSEARAQGPGVVMGRYGSTDAVFFMETDFWPHNTALFVTSFQGNDERWCYYLLRTISKADHSAKSAVPGVDRKDLFDIKVVVPPLKEQVAVARWIDDALAGLERTLEEEKRAIELIREYHTRLIADVVTGKLDVREAAAQLPSEVGESDWRDEANSEDAVEESPDDLDAVVAETEA